MLMLIVTYQPTASHLSELDLIHQRPDPSETCEPANPGAAMTLRAAVTGFILLLLCAEEVQDQSFFKPKCTPSSSCSIKGSTVEVNCILGSPPENRVQRVLWFLERTNGEPIDILTDPQYKGRVSVSSDPGRPTLVITDLRKSDSEFYHLKMETNNSGGKYIYVEFVHFTVTGVKVVVCRDWDLHRNYLECDTSCSNDQPWTHIWYKNGEEVKEETDRYDLKDFSDEDNFSCAVRGHEDRPSPPILIQDHDMWRIKCYYAPKCVLKGSEETLKCKYSNAPFRYVNKSFTVDAFWFTKEQNGEPVPLHQDPQYEGRVSVGDGPGSSILTIRDLRESDSAVYRVRLKTNEPVDTSDATVFLSVTDPDLEVQVRELHSLEWASLYCHSSCDKFQAYCIWYKNGEEIEAESYPSYDLKGFSVADSYSCALRRLPEVHAPLICVRGSSCNRVTYADRKICAPKGSALDISCSYHSYEKITSKFWFSPKLPDWWKNHSLVEDLSEDPQYADRVQVLETERGRSTLRIKELRESDSADYRFKFQTQSFEWMSRLPATTVSVTALQVHVRRISTDQSSTYAELRCLSSCSPADHFSYTWIRNGGTDIIREETFTYRGWFSLEDKISCALKGHEQFLSPPVYAPKVPLVVLSSFGEILENSSVTLTCSSDANPEANFTWFKKNPDFQPLSTEAELVFSSIQSADFGEYYCEAENQLGKRTSKLFMVDVKYEAMLIINAVRLALIPVIVAAVLLLHLWLRTKTALSSITERNQPEETVELESRPDDINPSALRGVPAVQTPDIEEQDTPV